jgi:hypothetical protein
MAVAISALETRSTCASRESSREYRMQLGKVNINLFASSAFHLALADSEQVQDAVVVFLDDRVFAAKHPGQVK